MKSEKELLPDMSGIETETLYENSALIEKHLNETQSHPRPDETGEFVEQKISDLPTKTPELKKRKVRLTRILGKHAEDKSQTSFMGLEEMPPEVGKSYRVLTGERKILTTSSVTSVFIQTQNSLYKIEFLDDN